jgi:uncharacterized protein (TIGR00730 family)
MPGGFGTMDEFFEVLTLVQTRKVENFPIVVMGIDYFQGLRDYLTFMVSEGTVSERDMDLVLFTDDPSEAIRHITRYVQGNYQIRRKRPISWLLERN